jgi:hypothetical protein
MADVCWNCGQETEFEFPTYTYLDGSEEERARCAKCGRSMTKEEWEAMRNERTDVV